MHRLGVPDHAERPRPVLTWAIVLLRAARRAVDTGRAAGRAIVRGPLSLPAVPACRSGTGLGRAVHPGLGGDAFGRPRRRLRGRYPGPPRAGRLVVRDGDATGVDPSTQPGQRFLHPLDLVERLVAALGGGHDLTAQLPPQLVDLLAEYFGLRPAAVGAQRDGEPDQHHGQDGQHRGEPQRPVAVRDKQYQRRDGSQGHTAPEEQGEQLARIGGHRGGHGSAAYRELRHLGTARRQVSAALVGRSPPRAPTRRPTAPRTGL
ncbi:hypothetical protein GCM10029963_52140 [Micromonospora andamanensis]